MSTYRVSIFDLLHSAKDGGAPSIVDPNRVLKIVIAVVFLANIGCAVVLLIATQLGGNFSWNAFLNAALLIPNDISTYFTEETNDCLWIALIQIVVFPLIAYGAIRSGAGTEETSSSMTNDRSCDCGCFRCFYQLGKKMKNNIGKYVGKDERKRATRKYERLKRRSGREEPLLEVEEVEEDNGEDKGDDDKVDDKNDSAIQSSGTDGDLSGFEAEDRAIKADTRKSDESYLSARSTAMTRRGYWLTFLYIVSTTMQCYLGLKCISFQFANESQEGALMAMGVVAITIVVWALKEVIMADTKESGELVPQIHPHRLHLVLTLAGHYCDQCAQQITGGRAYRCKLCDFDLCMKCFAKRDSLTLEGQLRGDKGVKHDKTNGDGENSAQEKYFYRALLLVQSEWKMFAAAIACLVVGQMLALWSPSYQGKILDSVVHADTITFNHVVIMYLAIAATSGAFQGLRSLLFNIVGRRLSNTLRVQLYNGIVIQDVAFFDGNSSGQLTSRLTNDVSFMVSPIQSMIGTLLSNGISLLGGVFFCFFTSWRLSMLAFITIGPLMHLTQVYAAWSQSLNRKIFSALAVANGFATEALSNIRTVKAFSTERFEQDRFQEAVAVSLANGIADSFAGAGMYTISSYLDLFTGILILWYGGLLAMQNADGLSPGKLITYQLYWNMMTGAYKGLLDILTSFTRAGGAASRVFALIDSMPDIDINAGLPVLSTSGINATTTGRTNVAINDSHQKLHKKHHNKSINNNQVGNDHDDDDDGLGITDLQGALELINVCFAYQMRPQAKVLTDVNVVIPAASVCAIVGKSGGGKSTLINLILRFYDPTSGCVKLDGHDMKTLRLRDVRGHIGVVMQNTDLFGGTILENITYGLSTDQWTRESVVEAATKACAHEFIAKFTDGYYTRVGERGVRISGGQKQRIAIARVFLRKPKILLLDEATSSLDAESESKVQEAIDRLIAEGGSTVILVAHRLSTVVNAHQIVVVSEGKVVEQGNHESLITAGGVYYNLVQKQLQKKKATIEET